MVYLETWADFETQSKALYLGAPSKVRHTVKYDRSGTTLIVKVTDDRVCLKYRTDQEVDVRRVGKLVQWFAEQMTSPGGSTAGDAAAAE